MLHFFLTIDCKLAPNQYMMLLIHCIKLIIHRKQLQQFKHENYNAFMLTNVILYQAKKTRLWLWFNRCYIITKWSSFLGLKVDFFSIIQHKIHVLIKTLHKQNISHQFVTRNYLNNPKQCQATSRHLNQLEIIRTEKGGYK